MPEKKKLSVILLLIFFFTGIAFCTEKPEKLIDPFENTSILVEAFLVRVSAEALAESGVNPISNAPEGISIVKILWCLRDPNMAKVISQAKAMTCHRKESKITNTKTIYIKSGNKAIPYKAVKEFNVMPYMLSNDKICVEVRYEDIGFAKNKEDSSIRPSQNGISWRGIAAVKSGVPVIAAAVGNDKDGVTFLVMTATVQE